MIAFTFDKPLGGGLQRSATDPDVLDAVIDLPAVLREIREKFLMLQEKKLSDNVIFLVYYLFTFEYSIYLENLFCLFFFKTEKFSN